MTVIATSRNLSMDTAGLIGRASGAGKSAILDAAAVRAFSNTLSSAEVASAISAAVSGIDLSGYLPLSGGTLSGNLGVTNIVGPGGSTTLVLNNTGTGGIFLQENSATRAWIGGSGVGIYTAAYPINSNLYDLGLTTRFWRKLFVSCIVPLSADLIIRDGTTAQAMRIDKTYTSDTNCEYLRVGFTGTNYDVVSRVGSAGGSNQPIRVGHLAADGTTFTGLTVATNGNMTVSGSTITGPGGGGLTIDDAAGLFLQRGGALRLVVGGSGLSTYADLYPSATASYDLGLTTRYFRTLYIGSVIASGAITASSTLTLQNSTTAVWAELSKTYTSSTNREYLYAGFSGTYYDLCSRVGSAGGSNQPIRVGHLAADGTTFAGVTVTTGGALQIPAGSKSAVSIQTGTGGAGYGLYFSNSGTSPGFGMAIGSISYLYTGDSSSGLVVHSAWGFCFGSSGADSTPDAKLSRKSSGLIAARGNSGFSVRNYADSSDAALNCAAITASGNITYVPATSVITLSTNGQCAIEFTSNTTGNIVYRGSDGTTRRFAFTVS